MGCLINFCHFTNGEMSAPLSTAAESVDEAKEKLIELQKKGFVGEIWNEDMTEMLGMTPIAVIRRRWKESKS